MALRTVLVTLLLTALIAPVARAQDPIDAAVESLRTDPVYVEPDAERAIGEADADRIRDRISARDAGPMYIAILPDSAKQAAGGSAEGVIREIQRRLGRPGTYAVLVGDSFRAGSTDVSGTAEQATAAFQASDGDVTATLLGFVDRMAELRAGNAPSTGGSGGEDGGGIGALVLLPIVLVVVGSFIFAGRRRRRAREAELAELKENVRDDLVALGDDIRALDIDVEMPGADPYAKDDYGRAVEAYDRANGIWKTARAPEDFEPVTAALEEGRYAMTSAKARMEGREPPERTPPCFFDPRHGPSSREVEWAPYGGAARLVPACEADAQRVERGEDPQAREVLVGGRRTPYWNAGPMYAPFAGGYFGSAILPGLLVGTFLGGAWGAGDAWGSGDGGSGGGDWGGGDFGGGGGDFGGGGGDFGGGDF